MYIYIYANLIELHPMCHHQVVCFISWLVTHPHPMGRGAPMGPNLWTRESLSFRKYANLIYRYIYSLVN